MTRRSVTQLVRQTQSRRVSWSIGKFMAGHTTVMPLEPVPATGRGDLFLPIFFKPHNPATDDILLFKGFQR